MSTKPLKIAIVGADGRKWTKEQELRVKSFIKSLLRSLQYGKELLIPPFEFRGTVLYDTSTKQLDFDELVVVSGHCPVGEERYYCIDCQTFLYSRDNIALDFHRNSMKHKVIKVFDQGGVDTWVEIETTRLGIKTKIFPALAKDWNDIIKCKFCGKTKKFLRETATSGNALLCKDNTLPHKMEKLLGYRSRNIQIAKVCDILYDLEPKGNCKYCKGTGLIGVPIFDKFGEPDGVAGEPCQKCEGEVKRS